MSFSLNTLYRALGISRQAVHKHLDRQMKQLDLEHQLHFLISKIRKNHPEMGMREMYFKILPEGIGRDKFEQFCRLQNYRVKTAKNYRRTTNSLGVTRFENLIKNIKIDKPNQLWQSDITYYEIDGKFCYITFIQDASNKVIKGHSTSRGLSTEQTTLPAIQMALKKRKNRNVERLIFHSDGGGQYYDKAFLKLTGSRGIINSMCEYPWDNGMAESLNGVIKNKYLRHHNIKSFLELQKQVDRTVALYNQDKPHSRLGRMTPNEFEKKWIYLLGRTKAKMTESFDAEHQMKGALSPNHLSQTKALNQDVFSANKNL